MHHCVGIIASPQKAMHIGLLEGIYFNIVEAILGLPGKFTQRFLESAEVLDKNTTFVCLFMFLF